MARARLFAVVTAALAAATPAWSHHSFAMFERDKQLTLTGVVRVFQWTNPHTWLVVAVPDEAGKAVDWAIEGGSPLVLSKVGWSKESFKPGDHVVVVTKPLKSGEHGGSFVSATLPGGRVLTESGSRADVP